MEGGLGPANSSDLAAAEELLAAVAGWVLADRSDGWPRLTEQVGAQGGCLAIQGDETLEAAAAAVAGRPRAAGSRSCSAS